jgi:hypothetical protein
MKDGARRSTPLKCAREVDHLALDKAVLGHVVRSFRKTTRRPL